METAQGYDIMLGFLGRNEDAFHIAENVTFIIMILCNLNCFVYKLRQNAWNTISIVLTIKQLSPLNIIKSLPQAIIGRLRLQ